MYEVIVYTSMTGVNGTFRTMPWAVEAFQDAQEACAYLNDMDLVGIAADDAEFAEVGKVRGGEVVGSVVSCPNGDDWMHGIVVAERKEGLWPGRCEAARAARADGKDDGQPERGAGNEERHV